MNKHEGGVGVGQYICTKPESEFLYQSCSQTVDPGVLPTGEVLDEKV